MAMRVQVELFRLGFYKGTIDGKMGASTRQALKDFQNAEGLAATGTMDNATLAKLGISGI
ncbi:His-Xaa-Ser repeat protein HxsA [Azospirillum sp. RU38E]|nr:His-Xaa-Ser repeat protein HxsA [Azospirillum sp. RU38E]SNT05018.1 His-Xaa-Ser repeat protein HxsA [Azospirillum sp. RU37A]